MIQSFPFVLFVPTFLYIDTHEIFEVFVTLYDIQYAYGTRFLICKKRKNVIECNETVHI